MRLSRAFRVTLLLCGLCCLGACDDPLLRGDIDPSGSLQRSDYLALRQREQRAAPETPQPVAPPIPDISADAEPPAHLGHTKLVSVTVTDTVPLRDVLIELAREAKVNLELDPRVQGSIIFTAHDQPFDQVLNRICALAGLRARQEGNFIHIEMDDPYQQTYALDYLSLSRKTTSETSIATNVFDVDVANGTGINGSYSGGSSRNGATTEENNSTSKVAGTSDADFWGEVEKSLTQILASTARKSGDKEAANFSIDKQAGIVTVFGDSRQQASVDSYFRKLKRKANAQVLIDARIIEVELDDTFKSGIDWQTLFAGAAKFAADFTPAALTTN